jgi:subtilisin family serine protease
MGRRAVLVLLLLAFSRPLWVQAQDSPSPEAVLIRLSTPSAIALEAGEVQVLDPALRGTIASLTAATPRLVRDGTHETQPLLLLHTGPGEALANALSAIRSVPCVLRAEPNYILVSDDASQPSDYFFQMDVWPYEPFSDSTLVIYHRDWAECELTTNPTPWVRGPTPNSAELRDGWHLEMTQANLAWLVESGSKNVIVAIIDSGVDWQHPDLAPNIWNNIGEDVGGVEGTIVSSDQGNPYAPWQFDPADTNRVNNDASGYDTEWVDDLVGWRFHSEEWPGQPTLPLHDPNHGHCVEGAGTYGWVEDQGDTVDMNGYQNPHGTQMASIIGAAHNGFGCTGMAPNVSMMVVNAGKSIEDYPYSYSLNNHSIGVAEMLEGMNYAVRKGADIINISLSYSSSLYDLSEELEAAITSAAQHGVIICCSAGNTDNQVVRWPAAFDSVLTCAAVRADTVKASQSSFACYVDFCAPSGDKNQNLTQFIGDEYMAAVKYAEPEPLWPMYLAPHLPGAATGPIHTYKELDGDTSGAAAQLSGAFALLKAHYPSHNREQLISEMIRGAVDIDPFQPPDHPEYIGKLGHGLINPYRSLTEWGGPRGGEIPNVQWSGEVWVSGDYVVPEDAALTIAAGTTVYIANFDNEAAGSDPQHIEIAGRAIHAAGTAEAPVQFVSFGPDAEGAAELVFRQLGPNDSQPVKLQHCTFIGFSSLSVDGSASAESTLVLDCTLSDPGTENAVLVSVEDAWLRGCTFESGWTVIPGDNAHIEWCKFEHVAGIESPLPPLLLEGGGNHVFVENSIFRDAKVAIRAVACTADTLFLDNVLVEHAYDPQGIDRGELGVDVQGGMVKATGLTVRGYLAGASLQGSGRFSAEYSSFTDCYQAALNNVSDNLMFFGYYQEDPPLSLGGHNVFVDNEKNNIANFHYYGTVQARKCWWGSPSGPPAKSNRGRVDALFPLLVDPNLPPPPDFMVLVEEPSPPFSVGRNYPNPFNPVTEFTITVPRGGGLVRATVYDIRGRSVRRLLDKALPSGEHRIEFNGKNDAGEALPSGMYLCRFNFGDREEVVKATLVK